MRRTDLPGGGGEVSATAMADPVLTIIAGMGGGGTRDGWDIAERLTGAVSTTTAGTSPRTMQQLAFRLAIGAEW